MGKRLALIAAAIATLAATDTRLLAAGLRHAGASKDSQEGKAALQPLPSSKELKTQAQYQGALMEVLRKNFQEPFMDSVKDNPVASQHGCGFLEDCFGAFVNEPGKTGRNVLRKEKSNASSAVPANAVFDVWKAFADYNSYFYDSAERGASKALAALKSQKASDVQIFFASLILSNARERMSKRGSKEDVELSASLISLLAKLSESGELGDYNSQICFRTLGDWADDECKGRSWKDVWAVFKDKTKIDPWLFKMIEGSVETELAWDARGGGYAGSVTKEGWDGFKIHLEKARNLFDAAWKARKDRPEAPMKMITVVMGGHGFPGDTKELWLRRSMEAQFDYFPACVKYTHASLPRWGGSYKQIVNFGSQCLDTARFETEVPHFYIYCLNFVGDDLDNYRWRAPYRAKDVPEKIDRLFSGLLADPSREPKSDQIKLEWAFASAWAGNFEKAAALLKTIPKSVDEENSIWGGIGQLTWHRETRKGLEAEVRMFTGPSKQLCQTWLDAWLDDNDPAAAKEAAIKAAAALKPDKDAVNFIIGNTALMLTNDCASDIWRKDNPLGYAIRLKDKTLLNFMLDNGYDPDFLYCGVPEILAAAYRKDFDSMKLLLSKNANIDATDESGQTPLICVSYRGPLESAEFLVGHGANIEHVSGFSGQTPLLLAMEGRQYAIARMLIEHNANVNAKEPSGTTALHYAARGKDADILLLLLSKGADKGAKDRNGKTPLDLAIEAKIDSNVKALSK